MNNQQKTQIAELINGIFADGFGYNANYDNVIILADYLEEIGESTKSLALKYLKENKLFIQDGKAWHQEHSYWTISYCSNKRLLKLMNQYCDKGDYFSNQQDCLWAFILAFEEDYDNGFPSYRKYDNL